MNQEYNILLRKLKGFISKYYTNLILKGLIISLTAILTMFLLVNTIEYFAWNSILLRTIIFYVFISVTIGVLVFYVVIPLFKLAKIGKSLSFEDAAKIIGNHFADVSDKLLNTIQLQNLLKNTKDTHSINLLNASIDQKTTSLRPIPFKKAVNLKSNYRYIKFLVVPVLVLIIALLVFPSFIVEPSSRIVHYNDYYTKPLPYRLTIENNELIALQKEDFTLIVNAEGEAVPSEVLLNDGKYTYKMSETDQGKLTYTFKNLSTDVYFSIETEDYKSEIYKISVLPKPTIYSFDVLLDYPAYLKRKDDVIENSGDLIVPEGTRIKWLIYTRDTEQIIFKQANKENSLVGRKENQFSHEVTAMESFWYTLSASNQYVQRLDSISFNVQVIKDEYPSIEVTSIQDETQYGLLYFNGTISDDHGFRTLKFYYRKNDEEESAKSWNQYEINIDQDLSKQLFNHSLKAQDFNLEKGTGLDYYFEVRDNDKLNGYKTAKTGVFQFYLEGNEEIKEKFNETSEKLKEKIKQALDELETINEEIEKKRNDLFEKKKASWTDKQQITELLKKQQEIENQISELKQLNEEINKFEELLNREQNELLEEKIDQLNKMFEQLSSEDFEKMKESLENLDKERLNEMLKNIEKDNQELQTDLEQNLELYKQLELEKKIEEAIDQLNKLAEEQQKLAEETKEESRDNENALEEQNKIQDQFSKLEEELEKANQLNNELEQPFEIDTNPEISDSINSELNEASEKLEKGKQKKASQNQDNAGEQMKKMADDLGMMMQSAMMSRMGEDAEKMKKILDNLVDLSFNQESLMNTINNTSVNDPKYVENITELQLIKDGYLVLHDSLIAISKRQIAVQQFIVKESERINLHINRALLYLQDRRKGQALNDQQYSMTSMNNLALMLSESLDQMQAGMQMAGQKAGKACPNPGQSSPGSMEEMIKMQQGLNQGMENGQKKSGSEGEQGLNQDSEALARMAATQSEIRKRLQEYMEQLEGSQGSSGNLSKLIDEMKKTEDDIVNRKITKETLERQKQIEVRLLKSEKAKLEREKKEQREAKEGLNRTRVNLPNELINEKTKENKKDIFHTAPIEMTPYFNDLLKRYLYKLETKDGS